MKSHSSRIILLITVLNELAALMVMIGWVFHYPILVQILPSFAPMQFNTALVILFWSIILQLRDTSYPKLSFFIITLVLFFLALTLFEYLFDINVGADTLFIYPFLQIHTSNLGRMAPNTAIALFMIGSALLMLRSKPLLKLSKWRSGVIGILGILSFSFGFIPLIGYANGIESAYAWSNFTRMSVITASTIALLSVCVLHKLWHLIDNRLLFALIGGAIGGSLLSISMAIAIYNQEDLSFERNLQMKAYQFVSVATLQLQMLDGALGRMASRWVISKGSDKAALMDDVQNYIKDFPYIRMIEKTDQTTKVQWVIPYEGNEKIVGSMLKLDPVFASQFAHLPYIRPLKLMHTGSVFSQISNKQLLYSQLFIRDLKHKGLLIAEIDMAQFFSFLFTYQPPGDKFFVSIHSGSKHNVLFSNIISKNVLEKNKLLLWSKTAVINYNGQRWTVTVNPSLPMFLEKNTLTPLVVLLVGLLMSALASMAVFFALRWYEVSKKLLETQQLNNAIMDSSTYLIVATDLDGKVILFNNCAQQVLGYDSAEIVNQVTPAIWHDKEEIENRAKELSDELGKSILPGFDVFTTKPLLQGKESREWTFIRKNGSTFPGLLVATPLRIHMGKKIGFVGIIEDLTERKYIEQKLEKYTSNLERSNHELEEFAYAASHDLKAPLRVIDNASKWLEEDLQPYLKDETLENMNLLRGRVVRMEKLLDDLLQYSRIGRIMDSRYEEIIHGDALINDILILLSPAKEFKVTVSSRFKDIRVARMPLQQILLNLMGNAIKHHDKKKGHIDVSVQDSGAYYTFAVKDDGPGIPAQYHEQIFKMFQTLKPRDQVEGSGMGLAIVKKNIDILGGALHLESSEGKGSIFSFTYPKQQTKGGKK